MNHPTNDLYQRASAIAKLIPGLPHVDALQKIPEMFTPYVTNAFDFPCALDGPIKAAVFNIERGFRLEELLIYLTRHPGLKDIDILLANELDWGMKRTNNRNITAEIASVLKMNCVFGLEFVSLSADAGNCLGLHGNAVFSKTRLTDCKVIHLPIVYEWFDSDQPRLGSRNAVFAKTEINGREIGLISAHLENRTDPRGRLLQFEFLHQEALAYFGDLPLIMGGDMNTNCVNGANDLEMVELAASRAEQLAKMSSVEAIEPLMTFAERNGWNYRDANLLNKSTRRKDMKGYPDINLNLDWFFTRGLNCVNPAVVTAVFNSDEIPDGTAYRHFNGVEISDHDAITVEARFAGR